MLINRVIPGNQTSTIRIGLGETFTELSSSTNDQDAIGIDLIGGQSYRITLDPATEALLATVVAGLPTLASKDPLIQSILDSSGSVVSAGDDDSGSGPASTLIFTPSVSGTYFIVSGNGDTGWWTLEVNEFEAPADDFSNALDASNPISIGETQDGHIGADGDTDTIAISLTAGVAVDITLYGNDVGFFGELADTEIISFVDAGGVAVDPALLETADAFGTFTSGGNTDAHQISFTPTVTGNYFLTVGAGPGEAIGDYSVSVSGRDRGIYSVRENEKFVATGNPEIDMFFLDNFAVTDDIIYADRDGDGTTTLTYSVPDANPGFSPAASNVINSAWTNGFAPATGDVLNAWEGMIDYIESFSKIDFVEVPDNGVEAGTLRIGTTELVLGSASGAFITGWAGAPGWMIAGETWINLSQAAGFVNLAQNFGATNQTLENWVLNRTLHEFGHAFGLNHPDFSTISASVDPSLLGYEYSIMTRAGSGEFPNSVIADLQPQTLMWFDIQALQGAYGVDAVTTAGDDIFTLANNERHFKTLWDYGGNDTLALPGGSDLIIDLTPGTWQDVGTAISHFSAPNTLLATDTDTVFIAPDTVIENVTAGGGDDVIKGNNVDNRIQGGSGADELHGDAGSDTLVGGKGADTLFGDTGSDRLVGGTSGDELRGGGAGDTLDGGGGADVIWGELGADDIIGDLGADDLRGGGGRDTLDGGGGADSLFGDDGHDLLMGGLAGDRLVGGEGNDTLDGGATHDELLAGQAGDDSILGGDGNDSLNGGGDDDTLDGGNGHDTASGGSGDDLVHGDAGDDLLLGGNGTDTIDGGNGDDRISGAAGADSVTGGAGEDVLKGNDGDDTVEGGNRNDTLNGGADNDWLNGGNDDDRLVGAQGDDTLTGGSGNDVLFGNAGDDLFVFAPGSGVDEIGDFQAGAASDDVIELSGFGVALDEFTEIQAAASDDGNGNTIIDLGGGDSVILIGVLAASLDAGDFIFV